MLRFAVGTLVIVTASALAAPGSPDISTASPDAIAEHFNIYLLPADKRNDQEKIIVTREKTNSDVAAISYWRSLASRSATEEICNAYQWLLFGRGAYGKGVREAFEKFPTLSKIYLRFFDVEGGTRLTNKKAEVVPAQRIIPYLRVGVERESLLRKRVDWARVKEEIGKGKCAEAGNPILDEKWFDRDYLLRGKVAP